MPAHTAITAAQLSRLVGLPDSPAIIDVRLAEDVARDPRLLPGAVARPAQAAADWMHAQQPGAAYAAVDGEEKAPDVPDASDRDAVDVDPAGADAPVAAAA